MGFKGWLQKYGKVIALAGAIIVFASQIIKDNIDDARRDVDKIDAAQTAFEHGLNVSGSDDLRDQWDAVLGKPATTPAEERNRLSMRNHNNELIESGLSSLRELSMAIGNSFENNKIDALMKDCETARLDYETAVKQLNLYEVNHLANPLNVTEAIHKFNDESRKLATKDAPAVVKEVEDLTQEAYTNANEKLLSRRYIYLSFMVLGLILNVVGIIFGIKTAS